MSIPADIRSVPRPRNTVVVLSGARETKRYAVRERIGVKYGPAGNPRPINGPIIGHIVDHQFVPVVAKAVNAEPDMLSYGAAAFIRDCSADLLDDLSAVYSVEDAQRIMAIASVRVLKPKITMHRIDVEYRRTFISRYYPDLALSANAVSSLFQQLGKDGAKRRQFHMRRIRAMKPHPRIAIGNVRKQNTVDVNDLSTFSYNAHDEDSRGISIIYAYDLVRREPVCAEVFPDNSIDAAASCRSFMKDNDIDKGILIFDEEIPREQLAQELASQPQPQLQFITPIKLEDSRIAKFNTLEFQGVLKDNIDVLYKKERADNGQFLYVYKTGTEEALKEPPVAERAKKNSFGMIVLESNEDLDPDVVYRCCKDRRQIERIFQRFKNDAPPEESGVQDDFSVIGSEFINCIAATLTCRMLHKAEAAGLLDNDSWSDLMDDLSTAWRRVDGPLPAQSDDDAWVHTTPSIKAILEKLGLSEKSKPTPVGELVKPGRRGRPKGSKNKTKTASEKKEPPQPKRKPERPKVSKA